MEPNTEFLSATQRIRADGAQLETDSEHIELRLASIENEIRIALGTDPATALAHMPLLLRYRQSLAELDIARARVALRDEMDLRSMHSG